MLRRSLVQWPVATSLAGLLSGPSRAQGIDVVTVFYGFPPGGTADIVSRRVADQLAPNGYARTAAIAESRPGAGGRIACDTVKAAAPDGMKLLLTPTGCLSLYPHVFRKLSYDGLRDFAPLSTAALMTFAFAVGPAVPASVTTLKAFLAWAQVNSKHAHYGSPGGGSAPHFLAATLALNANVALRHIPYRGSTPGVTDLIGGQISAMCTPTGDFLANYRAGKLRLLATSGAQRTPFTPEVPTFAEAGFAELTAEEPYAFFAPAKTPPEVIAAANAAIRKTVADKSVVEAWAMHGLVAQGSSGAELGNRLRQEYERWEPLVRKVGFTADS